MKVYNLHCEHDHRFEGWFSSALDFQEQLSAKRIACPICESCCVTRLPSSPRLRRSAMAEAHVAPGQNREQDPGQQQQILEFMRRVVARTEDVGERFAEEARRMHYLETPERAIRGVASRADCEALAEEGIAVLPLPPSLKQPLQ